jgi:hypothetical protein
VATMNITPTRFCTFIILYLFAACPLPAKEIRPIHPQLAFEPNRGQADSEVKFLARTPRGSIFLTDREIVFSSPAEAHSPALRMHFVGGSETDPQAESPTGGFVNYYLSGDSQNWLSHLSLFGKIRYRQVFSGIDAVFHADGPNLEFDFEVSPGSSPERIAFAFAGAERISATEDGGLDIVAGTSRWHLIPPRAYQQRGHSRIPIEIAYHLSNASVVSLQVGKFDPDYPLLIDPVVAYADILYANAAVTITGLQVDGASNLLMGGYTFAQVYPVENGQGPNPSGSEQVVVTKLNSAGDRILYSTFLPAKGFSSALSLAVDAGGNAYLAGIAGDSSFPVTSTNLGSCSQFCNAGYVAKFDPSGALLYSTLLGSGQILPYSIAVDTNGHALVAGGAFDNTMQTVNAFQSAYQGGECTSCGSPFFAEINASGTDFVFSSYFGGPSGAAGPSLAKGIAIDASGNVLIAGIATADPPLMQPWQYGDGDMFLAEFAPDGKTLQFSTRLGGSGDLQPTFDTVIAMAVGPDGTVYLTGDARTPDFPFSLNAASLPPTIVGYYSGGMYILAVDPSLTSVKYSTFLGGGNVTGLAVDNVNHVHVIGNCTFFPLSPLHAVVSDLSQGGFVAELDPTGTPVSVTQFGGHYAQQIPTAVAVDANLSVYLGGSVGGSSSFVPFDVVSTGVSLNNVPNTVPAGFFAKISPTNAPELSVTVLAPSLFLRNAGSADLHISNITLAGGLQKQWGNCGSTIPAGTSCVLTVSDSQGNTAAGTVTIDCDAASATQSFTMPLPQGAVAPSPIGDILVFQDVFFSFLPQLQATPSPNIPLQVWNVGAANAVIGSITATGITSETNNCGTLVPGASCTVQVSVSPSTALNQGSLNISYDNNNMQGYTAFYVTPSTQPILLSIDNSISFATQQINGVAIPRTVNVSNTSNSTIPAPAASLQVDPAFTISGNTCTAPLAPHATCAVAVVMNSTTAGTFNGMLTIAAQGGSSTLSLFGIAANNTLVQTSPLGLDFGPIALGGTATLPLQLTNSAMSPFAISSIRFSLPDYTKTDTCQGQIPVNGTCTVLVTLQPQQLGLRRAAAKIGVSISSVTTNVILSGTGVQPFTLQAAPNGSLSATVQSGGTANYQLQVIAAAGFAGTVQLSCSNAPQDATCSLPQSSFQLTSGVSSNFAVKVSTTVTQTATTPSEAYPMFAALIFAGLFTFKRKGLRAYFILAAFVGLLYVAGGGGTGPTQTTTPAGTYSLTLTGSSGNSTQSVTLTLVVQ